MHALKLVVVIAWIVFWIYWIVSAVTAKHSIHRARRVPLTGVTALAIVLLLRLFRGGSLQIHSVAVGVVGVIVFACGLSLAIWARVNLGENWGMPMTQKEEPELVTSGPYRFVRHPIYTGLLLGVLGTVLVTNVIGLVIFACEFGFFTASARVEERNLSAAFPQAYPAYRERTKMLVPFVF